MGLAAATIEPILELGRGAVVFAAIGAASAVALASAALMFGMATVLASWRRLRKVSASAGPVPRPSSALAPVGNPLLEELVGGLATQLA